MKLSGGDISQRNVDTLSSVREYYASAVAYVLKWFPLDEPRIKDSEFIDFDKKEECSPSMILTSVERFPKLLPFSHQ